MEPSIQPSSSPSVSAKKRGSVVGLFALLLLLIIAILAWPQPAPGLTPTTTGPSQTSPEEDFGSLEAELEATEFESFSEGL